MVRNQRWVKKVTKLLADSGVTLSQTPTNVNFYFNVIFFILKKFNRFFLLVTAVLCVELNLNL